MNAEYDAHMQEEAEKHGFGEQPDGTMNIGVGADHNIRKVVMNFGEKGYALVYPDKAIEIAMALIQAARDLQGENN